MSLTIRKDEDGQLDEVLCEGHVHIERQGEHEFWIGIARGKEPMVHVRTGLAGGKWYFRVEEDGGESYAVEEEPLDG